MTSGGAGSQDAAAASPSADAATQSLIDRAAIVDATTRMATAADDRDWSGLRACFAGEIELDYTSLAGGAPERVAADELVARWRRTLGGFEATQHLVANHLVDLAGDEATCTASFQATHLLPTDHGAPLWTLGGTYRYGLRRAEGGWRIHAVTMTATWADGNQLLPTLAAERGAAAEDG